MYSEKFSSIILEKLSNLQIPQEILYLKKGAENYYQAYGQSKTITQTSKEKFSHSKLNYISFIGDIIVKKSYESLTINLISLGCGNGFQEKELLAKLLEKGYTISYFGIDNSETMLQLAEENLKEFPISQTFICADFCLEVNELKQSLEEKMTNKKENKAINLFALMGKTISNFEPAFLLSKLHKLITIQGDNYLWLELFCRYSDNFDNQEEKSNPFVLDSLRKRYTAYLESTFMQTFFLNPLKELGINTDKGKLILLEQEEERYDTKVFEIAFEFEEQEKIRVFKKEFCFLPTQKLVLYPIRNFYLPRFEKLLDNSHFCIVAKEEKHYFEEIIETQFVLQVK